MRSFASLLLLVSSALALSRRADHVLHERRAADPAPRAWKRTRKLEAERVLPLRIGLKQQNTHLVDDLLMDIAHPESASYGQHWTPERVADFFAPASSTVDAVMSWLNDYELKDRVKYSASKGWLQINATVAEAEELLGTEYHLYTHSSGAEQISCDEYHVPNYISDHVELVAPTVHFDHRAVDRTSGFDKRDALTYAEPKTIYNSAATLLSNLSDLTTCDQLITPNCLRALYSIDYKPVATDKNSFGVVQLTPNLYQPDSLDLFFGNFSPTQVGQRPTLVSIDGGQISFPDQHGSLPTEANLDLQYAMVLSNQSTTLLQVGEYQIYGSINGWLDAVDGSYCTFEGGDDPQFDPIYPDPQDGGYKGGPSCGIVKPPNVVSISYAANEVQLTTKYAERQCLEYAKLGLLGTSVLYPSGDNGVSGFGDFGIAENGHEDTDGARFSPTFPSTCPYVTSVGATQITPGKTVADPEQVANEPGYFASGGGFSNIFPMPDYQKTDVASYLKNTPPPYTSEQFNNSGNARAYPDLSANGYHFFIWIFTVKTYSGGTSASTPTVAAIISLINDARIAEGKNSVGFLNPLIYSSNFRSAFHDITEGSNPGCNTTGFSAEKGWDPSTGVGTPNMTALMPLFLSLP